ncbi:bacteriocin [Chryseobacterium tongliaoense]|uniref:bacteriocin n=1 Tax=Chryseobacterium tongliaoense TaxID=3240933 RepID=UPI003514A40D
MENLNLSKGKRLNKKELRTITGGMLDCMQPVYCPTFPCDPSFPQPDENGCTLISSACAQKICRPVIDPV